MTTQDDVLVKNNPAKEAGHVIPQNMLHQKASKNSGQQGNLISSFYHIWAKLQNTSFKKGQLQREILPEA